MVEVDRGTPRQIWHLIAPSLTRTEKVSHSPAPLRRILSFSATTLPLSRPLVPQFLRHLPTGLQDCAKFPRASAELPRLCSTIFQWLGPYHPSRHFLDLGYSNIQHPSANTFLLHTPVRTSNLYCFPLGQRLPQSRLKDSETTGGLSLLSLLAHLWAPSSLGDYRQSERHNQFRQETRNPIAPSSFNFCSSVNPTGRLSFRYL